MNVVDLVDISWRIRNLREERHYVLEGLRIVDAIVAFGERTEKEVTQVREEGKKALKDIDDKLAELLK